MIITLSYEPRPPLHTEVARLDIQAVVYRVNVSPEKVTGGLDSQGQVEVTNSDETGQVSVLDWTGIHYVRFGFAFMAGGGMLGDRLEDCVNSATMSGHGLEADLVAAYASFVAAPSVFLPVFDSRVFFQTPENRDFVRHRSSAIPAAVYTAWNKGAP